ncbi:MAG: DNA ligase D [Chloroflexi bacterium]|nr:DNA ligase D [Chloroflexota bacterium]
MPGRLDKYRRMRDFSRTAEPDGGTEPQPAGDAPRFVVQEHHATALHWDFRLERDGVLVSWAVPKGVPPDPRTNHRAIHTEDHPLSYYDFEGEIAEGNYGAGRVILWDQGTYETHKFRDSEVMVTLHGKRLHGKYVLFQTDGQNWMIHRMDPPEDPTREPMPARIEPMLARQSELPRDDAAYGFEIKWDGIRAILFSEGGRIHIQSRNLLDITKQYPELHELGESLGAHEAILDGEIVSLDADGIPSFARLQNRMGVAREADVRRRMHEYPATYMVFDLLYLDGHPVMHLPYTERRKLLESLELDGPSWKTPAYHAGDGKAMLAATAARGLEGVVAKRLDGLYEPGKRSGAWLKTKNNLGQEFVIGGWTPGAGSRQDTLGALLIGYYDRTPADAEASGKPQRLHFAGKVGTGFTDEFFRGLIPRLQQMERKDSPFDHGIPEAGARFVEPRLVAQVRFTEWTRAGTLRHPAFLGLRDDKDPREVVLETPVRDTEPAEQEFVGKPGVGARERSRQERAARAQGAEARSERASADVPGTHAGGARMSIEIEGRELSLSNLDKVLYPETGYTKAQMIDYYTRVGPAILPHLFNRPMTLKRYPNGVHSAFFYEKQCPSHAPKWVQTKTIFSGSNDRNIDYCLVNDLPTLVWLANLATLELHPLLSRAEDVLCPTSVVFDLDPGAPAGVLDCAEVAVWLRETFDRLGLKSFVKTSGSKGMQLYVPLNTWTHFDNTKPFAHAIARLLEREHPKRVVSSMSKAVRGGKVFIDWSQNDDHKTTVAVYSLRAREHPTVSTPLAWEEVERAIADNDAKQLVFEAPEVLERVNRQGDLFAPLLELRQELPAL